MLIVQRQRRGDRDAANGTGPAPSSGAGLDEAASEEERIVLLGFLVQLLVEGGANADAEIDEVERWLTAHVAEEPYLESAVSGIRCRSGPAARRPRRRPRPATSRAARLDPYNAVAYLLRGGPPRASGPRPRALAEASLEALRATGSHAAIARLVARAARSRDRGAGRAGGRGAGRAARRVRRAPGPRCGAQAGAHGARDGDPARRRATPRVRAAIDESRRLFERMGAGLWLARLDADDRAEHRIGGAGPSGCRAGRPADGRLTPQPVPRPVARTIPRRLLPARHPGPPGQCRSVRPPGTWDASPAGPAMHPLR